MSAVLPSAASFPTRPARDGSEDSSAFKPQAAHPTAPAAGDARDPSLALLRSAPPDHAPPAAGRRQGLILVVLLHVLLGWALASGLAKKAVEVIQKPIEMAVIQETQPPPPPPPPPKIEKIKDIPKVDTPPPPAYVPPPEVVPATSPQPVLSQVQSEPPKQVAETAPPPVAPLAPAAVEPKPIVKQDITAACPGYQTLLAQSLEDAFDRVGIAGTVRTLIKVRGAQIIDVQAQSGPKEYHKFLQTALKRLRCSTPGADEVHVTLDVNFRR